VEYSYDIAFRVADDPSQVTRADYLSDSALNSVRGYRALLQGRIPLEGIARNAGWHFNAIKYLQRTIDDLVERSSQTVENLARHDPEPSEYRPGAAIRRESEAREQLALDLALASNVFTTSAIRQPKIGLEVDVGNTFDTFESMSRATEAMNLDGDPPAVRFSFLRPIAGGLEKVDVPSSDDHSKPAKGVCPMGVRLLLQDWEPTTSTKNYSYRDPYNASDDRERLQQPHMFTQVVKPVAQSQQVRLNASQLKQPPAIVPAAAKSTQSAAAPVNKPRAPPVVMPSKHESQPTARQHILNADALMPFTTQTHSSQPFMDSQPKMTSTQILPGPFGGRAPVAKKNAKKRLGGF
jgi:hypothetical protein